MSDAGERERGSTVNTPLLVVCDYIYVPLLHVLTATLSSDFHTLIHKEMARHTGFGEN